MNFQDERRYLTDLFFAAWNANKTPVKVDNKKELLTNAGTIADETGLDEWVRLSIQPVLATQADMNATRRVRHTGLLDVSVFIKSGVGIGRCLELIDAVDAIYSLKSFNGITVRAGSVNNVGETAGFYQMTITFEYQWDTV
jgi:hypothetical protein